ncbi:MAG: glycosyltransferase family 39 protein [Candidatus Gastranaerophilales bacterium]|nr:glycosyltransferase family 39 protein [Candidatus Gastranaerophilales bacterium]
MKNIKKIIIFCLLLFLTMFCLAFAWKNHKTKNLINVIVETNLKKKDDVLLKINKEYFTFSQFKNVLNQTIDKEINSLELLINKKFPNKIKSIVLYNNSEMNYFSDFSEFEKSKESLCNNKNCKEYNSYKFKSELLKPQKTKISSFLDSLVSFDKSFFAFYLFLMITIFYGFKNKFQNKFLLPISILFLGIIFRLNNIILYKPWGDECYSILITKPNLPFCELFSDPGNPPFYYLILKIIQYFSDSILIFRLSSVLFSILGAIFLFQFLYKNYSKKLANLALALYAINLPLIYFSQEIRNYSLQVLLGILILIYTFKLIEKSNAKNWILYGILAIIAINTHYYQVLFLIANFVYLSFIFIKNKRKNDLIFLISITFLAFLSFLPYYLSTAHNKALLDSNFNTQLPQISFDLIKKCIFYIFGGFIPFIVSIFFLLKNNFKQKEKTLFIYTTWIIYSIILLGIILSLLIRPMLVQRYLLFLIPFVIINLSIIFTFEYKNKLSFLFVILCVILAQNYSKNSLNNIRMKNSQSYNIFKIAKEFQKHTKKKIILIIKPSDSPVKKLNKINDIETITVKHKDSYEISSEKIEEIKNKNKNVIFFTTLLKHDKNTQENNSYTCYFNSALDLCIWKIE